MRVIGLLVLPGFGALLQVHDEVLVGLAPVATELAARRSSRARVLDTQVELLVTHRFTQGLGVVAAVLAD